jgi:transcriptional regulator with XRE-family HTH domain
MADSARDFWQELGKRLKAARLKAGLTQQKLGVSLGMKASGCESYVSRLEQGKLLHLSFSMLLRYVQACHEPLSVFILGLARDGLLGQDEVQAVAQLSEAKPKPDARAEAKARKRERQWLERTTVRLLEVEIAPLVLPYCVGKHEFKLGAYEGAAAAFCRAWKNAIAVSAGTDPTERIRSGFDNVERIGRNQGLNPEAMKKVREAVLRKLTEWSRPAPDG